LASALRIAESNVASLKSELAKLKSNLATLEARRDRAPLTPHKNERVPARVAQALPTEPVVAAPARRARVRGEIDPAHILPQGARRTAMQ
jgi:hypothetical protein